MKIVFTGGETGGHFYPIIAIAEAVRDISRSKKLIEPEMYFLAPTPYNEKALFDNRIAFRRVPAGKMRIYSSIKNIFDPFKTAIGLLKALWTVFWIFPDVVFSKGGYGSVPVVWAAKTLGIPIIIHESDSAPGRANEWASKYAKKIALSYPDAKEYFVEALSRRKKHLSESEKNDVEDKTAWTGNPIRRDIKIISSEGAFQYLRLEQNVPVILVLGGSQGAKVINDAIMEALPELVQNYQIIHQAGVKNMTDVKNLHDVLLQSSPYSHRHKIFGYLDDLAMKMSAGSADLVISRAGSTIFEIANWKKPSIIIPITESNNDHQRKNAYTYARSGAAVVIEEKNLVDEILIAEINRIIGDIAIQKQMAAGAASFAKPEAADTIAREILQIALRHSVK